MPSSELNDLAGRLTSRTAVIAVMGLGYVGLPLVEVYIKAGFNVIGYDVDSAKINALKSCQSYIKHINTDWLEAAIADGRFAPTDESADLARADCILICVPTPLSESRDPDLAYVEATARTIAETLRPGQLISLESTTYPGTTRDVVLPLLEVSGMTAGSDFALVYSPEREDPGNKNFGTKSIPKVVGGFDELSLELGLQLYGVAVENTVPVDTLEIAEACKIVENTYRAVNIALVNELKTLFDTMNIDVWKVIDAASTKPFGYQRFTPGPGLGGHCIPIDPFYLSWLARRQGRTTRFIELAGEVNLAMPAYVVAKTSMALNLHSKAVRGARICVVGLAYKPDIDDPRESPAFPIIRQLLDQGALVDYHDPYIPVLAKNRHYEMPQMWSVPLTDETISGYDAIVVVTDHKIVDWNQLGKLARIVVDTRNVIPADSPGLVRA